jgi:uncharacterized protein YqjF (DUF2071 family)
MSAAVEYESSHRPWPLPTQPWVMFQSWRRLLFAHWTLPAERLRSLVPAQLELDSWEGMHWLGITPFLLTELKARGLPALPIASTFPEINVRTYVRHRGKGGIWFFSLDAGSLLAVLGARVTYSLPYFHARASRDRDGDWIVHQSARVAGEARFLARYRGVRGPTEPKPGSLEHFLTERYALYVVRGGRVLRGDIHHAPWLLRPAEAEIAENTMASAAGIELPAEKPMLHLAERQDTIFWPLQDGAAP